MNYSLLIIGDCKVDGDGGEIDGGGRDGEGDQWRWLREHFPIPAGCQNRGFCPPKFIDGGGEAAKLFLEILPTPLGFSVSRLYIGDRALSGGCQGLLTHRGRGQVLGHAALV
jgi:hypothetical protein